VAFLLSGRLCFYTKCRDATRRKYMPTRSSSTKYPCWPNRVSTYCGSWTHHRRRSRVQARLISAPRVLATVELGANGVRSPALHFGFFGQAGLSL
jgi:4'-phosphopantetheinyl transferase EntD